ncbi:MAG: beta-galactosidase [Anaerolineae bacterium]|nr:beta-galactosidase [Anaerolineae bacterium]
MGEQQQVNTLNSKVGVHTRLTDEVEEWKIQRTLRMVREMGSPWIVEYFPWAYIEGEEGQYGWDHSDLVIEHARNQGLQVIARLGMVPDWARPDPEEVETTFTYIDPEYYDEFARFAAAFVERYQGQVNYIIIWNEPNLSFEWGYRPVDPAAYVELLRVVYPVVHSVNPDIVVLAGALAPTLEPEGSPAGLNDLLYLEKLYEAGGAAYFDALAAHTYGLVFPPDMSPDPEIINFRRVELLRDIMDQHGDMDKLIYITEAGWNEHPRWTWAVKSSQRVTYTLDAYKWAADAWPWCPVVAMWMFRTPWELHNYQDYYAFVTPDFRERPVYSFVQAYTSGGAE